MPFKDRVVHQWYIYEFIKAYIITRFIKDTYACIDNRGIHKAKDVVQKYMKVMKKRYGKYYIIKCDISKFFYSIDKKILYDIMSKYIKDKHLLELTKILIYDNNDKKGIPIGNYTSQYFANIYLQVLDKYVKNELKIKYYVRYMDDFVLFVGDKNEARKILDMIKIFVKDKLNLELNSKSRYYPTDFGCNFCGYRIFETHILLRTRSKQKIKRKIKMWNKLYNLNELDYKRFEMQLNSWIAHANHANTYKLQQKIISKISLFKNEKFCK